MAVINNLARIIRSKNAGPFETTIDIIFNDTETFWKVKNSNTLTPELICSIYNIPREKLLAFVWFDKANAFKATIVRQTVSGSFGERDTYGTQYAAPLVFLDLPIE